MAQYRLGKWHGKKYYLGLHYDLHAGNADTELGAACAPEQLIPMLKIMRPDFVQTDCKGHPGITSWYSHVPEASVAPGIIKDALLQWREATSALKMPLHCHYSGIWDIAAAKKHPEWTVMSADGQRHSEKMCPRGPYLEKLLIPQLMELIDRYNVDGFWIDGDIWAVEPCYCPKCRQAFTESTGIAEAPTSEDDPNWTAWMNFQLESYKSYVTKYCDAVHKHNPKTLVCSNWIQTFKNPGKPDVPTDWISGDNAWIWGLDGSRCEARWLCNRGKPWDIMLWSFSKSQEMDKKESPWCMKPAEELMQEAAMLLSTGGNVQIYETTSLRNGQLVPWRMQRIRQVSDFIKARKSICQDSESFPVAAVLHSEKHYYSKAKGSNLLFSYDMSPVSGAVWALSESQIPLDILDEYALVDKLDTFPVVVVPEQTRMSDAMVVQLKRYVLDGGLLMLSGSGMAERFGYDYLGITDMTVQEEALYHLPVGKDETVPMYSDTWGLVTPTKSARTFGKLAKTPLRHERLTDYPATISKRHGDGMVMFIPADIFAYYAINRYPDTKKFIKEAYNRLYNDQPFSVKAPSSVDVVARCGKNGLIFHFINLTSGLTNRPGQGMVDEIPFVGPITFSINLGWKPNIVKWLFENENEMSFTWTPTENTHPQHDEDCDCGCCHIEHGESGVLTVTIQHLKIHGAIQIN